jgi:hypothetical protein
VYSDAFSETYWTEMNPTELVHSETDGVHIVVSQIGRIGLLQEFGCLTWKMQNNETQQPNHSWM